MSLLKYVHRKNTDSVKWDGLSGTFGREGMLPMWVADMDFETPECVKKALNEYVDRGVFGYHIAPDGYYDAFINWQKTRHNHTVSREAMGFVPGVVTGFNLCINAFTKVNDSVIVLTPVYYPFFHAVNDNSRRLVSRPLVNEGGYYTIDFALFEKLIVENDVKAFILCSPHNPVGRVWKQDELKALMDICKKHGVFVISDEIHQDFTYGEHVHIPTAAVGDYDDMLVTLTAPSKTFNLAACQNSVLLIPNEKLREQYAEALKGIHLFGGNSFGYVAAEAAWKGGAQWLDELRDVIHANYLYIKDALAKELPGATVSPLEGTYLLWVDLAGCGLKGKALETAIMDAGLAPDFGEWFGGEEYSGCIRLNLATTLENVKTAVESIVKAAR